MSTLGTEPGQDHGYLQPADRANQRAAALRFRTFRMHFHSAVAYRCEDILRAAYGARGASITFLCADRTIADDPHGMPEATDEEARDSLYRAAGAREFNSRFRVSHLPVRQVQAFRGERQRNIARAILKMLHRHF